MSDGCASPERETAATPARTVLVIEDEQAVRLMTEKALERFGYHVLSAGNGREGLELYKKSKDGIDAVLLDLTLPEMCGEDVFSGVMEINPDAAVVISSGRVSDEIRAVMGKQAAGFIEKPFVLTDLARHIETAVARS